VSPEERTAGPEAVRTPGGSVTFAKAATERRPRRTPTVQAVVGWASKHVLNLAIRTGARLGRHEQGGSRPFEPPVWVASDRQYG